MPVDIILHVQQTFHALTTRIFRFHCFSEKGSFFFIISPKLEGFFLGKMFRLDWNQQDPISSMIFTSNLHHTYAKWNHSCHQSTVGFPAKPVFQWYQTPVCLSLGLSLVSGHRAQGLHTDTQTEIHTTLFCWFCKNQDWVRFFFFVLVFILWATKRWKTCKHKETYNLLSTSFPLGSRSSLSGENTNSDLL